MRGLLIPFKYAKILDKNQILAFTALCPSPSKVSILTRPTSRRPHNFYNFERSNFQNNLYDLVPLYDHPLRVLVSFGTTHPLYLLK